MMLKQKIYRSINYPTPEKAQAIADNLAKIDGNEYLVYCEIDPDTSISSFYFDNSTMEGIIVSIPDSRER